MSALTKQEVFDKVALALLKQNKKSIGPAITDDGEKIRCMYLNPNGCRCAVGHMLNDEDLQAIVRWKENTSSIRNMIRIFFPNTESKEIAFIRAEMAFCRGLQFIHDTRMPGKWREEFIDFASMYELDATKVKEFTHE